VRKILFLPLLLILTACGSLQVAAPKSYSERIAAGYTAVSITNDAATILVNAGTVSKEDGRAVLDQTKRARMGLDAASLLDGQLGEDKLANALTLLRAAQDHLCAGRPNEPNCALMLQRTQP
jgi:hypothetical protein